MLRHWSILIELMTYISNSQPTTSEIPYLKYSTISRTGRWDYRAAFTHPIGLGGSTKRQAKGPCLRDCITLTEFHHDCGRRVVMITRGRIRASCLVSQPPVLAQKRRGLPCPSSDSWPVPKLCSPNVPSAQENCMNHAELGPEIPFSGM